MIRGDGKIVEGLTSEKERKNTGNVREVDGWEEKWKGGMGAMLNSVGFDNIVSSYK